MKLVDEILVNQYGQDLIGIDQLLTLFVEFDPIAQKAFLNDLLHMIGQSKPNEGDIEFAILDSGLKSTYTPCVILKKGVESYNLQKLINLPIKELKKTFVLLMSLFKIAYKRRFSIEKNDPNKWWYWDLSDDLIIESILRSK